MMFFCDDEKHFETYQGLQQPTRGIRGADLKVRVLDFAGQGDTLHGNIAGNPAVNVNFIYETTVAELSARLGVRLQIIFAPLDEPNSANIAGLMQLFRQYSIPSTFASERVQAVTQSFGTDQDGNQWNYLWFHVLCKNINVTYEDGGEARIDNPVPASANHSQSDYSWVRAGFVLRSPLRHASTNATPACVTLICFGASTALEKRFERLALHPLWRETTSDPCNLFAIILDELFLQMDDLTWRLGNVFSSIEAKTLENTYFRESYSQLDFVGLHNVAKHVIYLREGFDAILLTIGSMVAHHKNVCQASNPTAAACAIAAHERLLYKEGLFQSTNLRLKSVERRVQNIINLSFNLVTQQDSQIMLQDSFLMKTIAAVTLFFLPISTTASIFGSQFFSFDPSEGVLRVAITFWLFWAIALPLTVSVASLWYLYYRRAGRVGRVGHRRGKIE